MRFLSVSYADICSKVISPSTTNSGAVLSLGEGVEREVIFTAFEQYVKQSVQWFLPRADGYASLATSHSIATAHFVSAKRKTALGVLGALTSLLIIYGIAPVPFSPVLIHYFIHGCDLRSIHRHFLGEWYPELRNLLDLWIENGHQGSTAPFQAHFNTYHDIQVSGAFYFIFGVH